MQGQVVTTTVHWLRLPQPCSSRRGRRSYTGIYYPNIAARATPTWISHSSNTV